MLENIKNAIREYLEVVEERLDGAEVREIEVIVWHATDSRCQPVPIANPPMDNVGEFLRIQAALSSGGGLMPGLVGVLVS